MKTNERVILITIFAGAAALLFVGWRLFWFLCDDAYISFRYISNSILGHGYVWNPPPFRPVEGYTNFLWLVVLDGVWRLLGVEPPKAANTLTLLFSALTLALIGAAMWRMEWRERLLRFRPLFLALLLLAVLSNRTFLAWSSSGLETAMFNCCLTAWLVGALLISPTSWRWGTALSLSAAFAALTRPDGYLLVLASVLMWGVVRWKGVRRFRLAHLLELSPLLLVAVHIAWRRIFYGAWLPNTYYAKHTGWWPESGLRYALSFVIEYALWIWLIVAVVVLIRAWRRRREVSAHQEGRGRREGRPRGETSRHREGTATKGLHTWILTILSVTLAIHAGYYILVIGGDHFEYRVLSHLVLMTPLSLVWLLNRAGARPVLAVSTLVVWIVLSWPIPWTHWAASRRLVTRTETLTMRVSVAERWPAAFRWYAGAFDRLQFWLIEHYVCMRHQEHKVASSWWFREKLPTREEGMRLPAEGFPVMIASGGIGGLGWVLPRINLIDQYGLNDYVVARSPVPQGKERLMAHDRQAPSGYCESFRPNSFLAKNKRVVVVEREEPLSAEEIRRVEADWAQRVLGR